MWQKSRKLNNTLAIALLKSVSSHILMNLKLMPAIISKVYTYFYYRIKFSIILIHVCTCNYNNFVHAAMFSPVVGNVVRLSIRAIGLHGIARMNAFDLQHSDSDIAEEIMTLISSGCQLSGFVLVKLTIGKKLCMMHADIIVIRIQSDTGNKVYLSIDEEFQAESVSLANLRFKVQGTILYFVQIT